MAFNRRNSYLGVLTGAALLGMLTPPAGAQYRPQAPQSSPQPSTGAMTSTPVLTPPAARTSGFVAPQAFPGFFPGYGPVQYNGVAGGYLSGGADVINAQGNFLVQKQQANLTTEQVKQARIDTRRKTFDNWMYEREMTPTLEDDRERARMEQYRRSRNDPPLTEIWSGKALNDLLLPLQRSIGVPGPNIPLDPEMLRQINVTSGQGNASVGLLRDGGKLTWPVALQDPAFAAERAKIEQAIPQAMQQAVSGSPPAQLLGDIAKATDSLGNNLRQRVAEIDANEFIAARRYLNELNDSMRLLREANAAKYLTGQFSAQGRNVTELVFNMTKQGLRFAPATRGDQEAYTALHSAMVLYDETVHQFVARQPSKP